MGASSGGGGYTGSISEYGTVDSSEKQQQTGFDSSLINALSSSSLKNLLPSATTLQSFGENSLMQMLSQYMGGQNMYQATPQQKNLLSKQTDEYMKGLKQEIDNYTKSAVSQAQQSALARGIPLSDIARGMESNVYAKGVDALSQGYNQAKLNELSNLLNYPLQANQPFMNIIQQLGMSRLEGPRDVYSTEQATQQKEAMNTLSNLLNFYQVLTKDIDKEGREWSYNFSSDPIPIPYTTPTGSNPDGSF